MGRDLVRRRARVIRATLPIAVAPGSRSWCAACQARGGSGCTHARGDFPQVYASGFLLDGSAFFVHQAIEAEGGHWTLTHALSGCTVRAGEWSRFQNLDAAIAAGGELSALSDWGDVSTILRCADRIETILLEAHDLDDFLCTRAA